MECDHRRRAGRGAYLSDTLQTAVLRSDGGSWDVTAGEHWLTKCQEVVEHKSRLPHAATSDVTSPHDLTLRPETKRPADKTPRELLDVEVLDVQERVAGSREEKE